MSVRALFIVWAFLVAAGPAFAQGFGGLATDAEGFERPKRGTELQFPRDHGPHPRYRIEWWYLTANLQDADGRQYGVQWTLFRSALKPEEGAGWSAPQLWMGHAALTTPEHHYVAETRARGGIGQAGVTINPFRAWIDDWFLQGKASAADQLDDLSIRAGGEDFSYDLALSAHGPLVLQGDRGYSVKSQSGSASYYYSQPFYDVRGSLQTRDGKVSVVGKAWLDREWSSQPLAEDQKGWDWVSLHLDDGSKVMGFQLRNTGGTDFTSATWIQSDGAAQSLPHGALTMTPLDTAQVEGRRVPVEWNISLPSKNLDVTIQALNPKAWMATSFPYWEGPVKISGSHAGKGYLEMTGY